MRAGGTRTSNFTLAAAIEKAKGYSMPKDNIQRAIDRGTGAGGGDEQIERVVYEGYGPGGAAILVEALTDNRNRTGAEVRHAFDKAGGSLGEPGSVAWQFEKKGVVLVDARPLRRGRPDGGDRRRRRRRRDRRRRAQGHRPPRASLAAVREALEGAGVEVESAELAMEPSAVVEVAEESEARALMRLIEALDDHDDVEAVHANFDIPEALLEQAIAGLTAHRRSRASTRLRPARVAQVREASEPRAQNQ